MAINRDSGGVFHLNKDRKMSKSEIERMASAVGTSNSQHKQLVPWAQMNTSKEHFSPTNGEILPQKAILRQILRKKIKSWVMASSLKMEI